MNMDYYSRPEISNSDINTFHVLGAKKYKYYKDSLLDSNERFKTNKSIKKGRAFHACLLEENKYKVNYVPIDVETPKSPNQKQFCELYVHYSNTNMEQGTAIFRAYKESYVEKDDIKAAEKAGRLFISLEDYIQFLSLENSETIILSKKEHEDIVNAKEELLNDDYFAYLFKGEAYNELEVYWNLEWCTQGLRSKLDRLLVLDNKIVCIDIKTTRSAVPRRFRYDLFKYKIHQQLSFYKEAIQSWCMDKFGESKSIEMYVLGVDLEPPYDRILFKLSDNMLEEGKKLWTESLEELNWHYHSGVWINREFYENRYVLLDIEKETNEEEV